MKSFLLWFACFNISLCPLFAVSFYSDFETGVPIDIENYLEETTPSWSGPDLTNTTITTLPDGRTGATDDYMWIYDDSNTTISTDRFQIPFTSMGGSTSFSYFFHDRWDGRMGNPDFTDVAIMNSSMTSILIADIFLEDGAMDTWSEVSGTFTTATPWRVFQYSVSAFINGGPSLDVMNNSTVATQAQIDAILADNMVFQFGFEQISGGHSGDVNLRETMAVDNFSIVPEPAIGLLALVTVLPFCGRRRKSL